MKNFNITRFTNVVRWQLAERRGLYTYAATGFIIIAFATLLLPFLCGAFSEDYYDMSCTSTASTILAVSLTWYYLACGALIVSDLGDKRKRISAFLLPASRLEKFIARYLHLVIALPLAFIAGFVVGDLLQMGIYQVLFGNSLSAFAQFAITSVETFPRLSFSFGDTFGGLEALLWLHSLFLLIGTFFRRHAWILSNLLVFVAATLLIGSTAFVAKEMLDTLCGDGIYRVGIITTPLATFFYRLVALLVVIFNYWASFRVFSRMQAITNKTFNF